MHVMSGYGPWSVWANSSSVRYVQFEYVRWYHYLMELFPLFACARTVRDYYIAFTDHLMRSALAMEAFLAFASTKFWTTSDIKSLTASICMIISASYVRRAAGHFCHGLVVVAKSGRFQIGSSAERP